MKTIIIMTLFCSQHIMADQWFCSEESGRREGNVMYACGVGESMSEGYSRERALSAAINEFKTICEMSSDCKDREISVEPKRLECQHDKSGIIRCYRLIVVTISR